MLGKPVAPLCIRLTVLTKQIAGFSESPRRKRLVNRLIKNNL